MRVAFNATALLSPLTGIGQYSAHLAMGLAAHKDIEPEFFYGAFWGKEVRSAPLPAAASLLPWIRSKVPFSYALRRVIQNQRFSSHTRGGRFDIYHEPNILPLPFDGLTVVTVHDLSWIRFPQMHPPERVRAMDKYFESGLNRASMILTDSHFVKRELIDVFGVSPKRIRPIALGVESLFTPLTADATMPVLQQHSLIHGEYLLAVGTIEPRKNLQVALQAFMQLAPAIRKRYPLVLVGMKGWHTSELEQKIAPMIQSGEVRQLGYLSREDLAKVIAGALTLIYPSVYEGFGLPPLEAMACGVPVIAANVSSIPEVIGDTGLLIDDPHDVSALTEAIQNMVMDPKTRKDLSEKALTRSRLFTWDQCVTQTIDTYQKIRLAN
ncbi:glycosyltransferase family 4 protein [Undibacterium parvum]|nr:glycosyltransferase family 1 protein [Undibacterium parvum]